MKNYFGILLVVFVLTSCTKTGAGYRPVVDTANPNYEKDLVECQKLAKDYVDLGYDSAVEIGSTTAIGAGVGQLFGGNTGSTIIGAGIGAGTAGVKKILHHNQDRKDIVRNCLSNRGYVVLK